MLAPGKFEYKNKVWASVFTSPCPGLQLHAIFDIFTLMYTEHRCMMIQIFKKYYVMLWTFKGARNYRQYSEVVAQLHTHVTYSLAWAEWWLFSWCFISWSRGSWCALSIISLVQWPVAAPAECLTNFLLLVFGYLGSWKAANFAGQVLVHQALQLASSCAGSIYSCELQQIADLAGINTSALPAFSPKLQDFMGSIMIYPAAHWAGQKYMDDG